MFGTLLGAMAATLVLGFGATVVRKDFTVHRDGKVTLTLERTVHTLVFCHLPFLRGTTVISAESALTCSKVSTAATR